MMKMSSSRQPVPGDVWRLEFAFEEDPSISKMRPVVVAVVEESSCRAVVVKVTGHGPRREYPGEIRLKDWGRAGLAKPSTVRCSKSLSVELAVFESAQYYGHLSNDDELQVFAALRGVGLLK